MKISFIIPVLNGEKFIRRCIDSILQEADASDEVIILDNGSTDNTLEIARSYRNAIILQLPVLTVAALRNHGAGAAHGSLLAFIDADVILCSGWRRTVISTFEDNSIHAAGSRYGLPDEAGWIERAWYSQKVSEKTTAKYINAGNLIVRKEVFNSIGGFNPELVSDEDCELGERFNKAGFVMIEEPAIKAVHLGNPKSLRDFYRKERWHATSTLVSVESLLDRLNFLSVLFGISVLLAVASISLSVFLGPSWLWGVSGILLVPLITGTYRAYQFSNFSKIPALALLWSVFFAARIENMLSHISKS